MLLITLCVILIRVKIAHSSCSICMQYLLRCCWGHYNRGRRRVISAAQGKLFNFEYLNEADSNAIDVCFRISYQLTLIYYFK